MFLLLRTTSMPNYSIHETTCNVENGMNVALSAMIEHHTHRGVQDHAITVTVVAAVLPSC